MTLADIDGPRILELLQDQPNGRLETYLIDEQLEISSQRRVRALRELKKAGKVRSLLDPGNVRGGLRITQAVQAHCPECNGHGEWGYVDILGDVCVNQCTQCGGTGKVATTA